MHRENHFLIADSIQHPGLLELWSDNNSERLNNIKWKLFLSSISSNIVDFHLKDWKLLTEDVVGVTAALYYLFVRVYFYNQNEEELCQHSLFMCKIFCIRNKAS